MKSFGYSILMVSVALIGIPALDSLSDRPVMFTMMALGIIAAICGLGLRWVAHQRADRSG